MTHLDDWISVVAAANWFITSAQAIRSLVKLGIAPRCRDQAAEAQGIWSIWTYVQEGSLDEWCGVTVRVEHVRRVGATARSLTREQKIAISRVFVDHLERREAKERRAKERGGGSKP